MPVSSLRTILAAGCTLIPLLAAVAILLPRAAQSQRFTQLDPLALGGGLASIPWASGCDAGA